MNDDAKSSKDPRDAAIEALGRERDALAQQVKQLIRAEGKLYEYQEQLDTQLNEYKALYELNQRLSGILGITEIFEQTVAFIIDHLGFERAVFFLREQGNGSYCVCALNGYYAPETKGAVAGLTVETDSPCLERFRRGKEYLVCRPDSKTELVPGCRQNLRMDEYLVYPVGPRKAPHAILVVGNSLENAEFYRRVEDTPEALIGLGNLVGLVSSIIENRILIDRIEAAREQERVAQARYRGIFENAAEGIFQRTPTGRYVDANPALAQMFGYGSPEELIAEVTDIAGQLYVDPNAHDHLVSLLAEKGKVEGYETRFYRRDRSVFWISLSMREVRDDAGNLCFYEGMAEEVTTRKVAEEALRESEQKYRQLSEALEQRVSEAVDELRQKDKMLILQGRQAVVGEMISNIAHQWRQPLNMLALLVQDLQVAHSRGDVSDQFIQSNIRKTMDVIRQMSRTIDDFRYFFQPDEVQVEFRVFEPLEKALSLLTGSLEVHGIRTEVSRSGDPVVSGYLNEFTQVLLNILMNARDALIANKSPSPLISVRVFAEDGGTVVTVTDNAGGVPEEIIERIFDPYFTTKGPGQGTGIGLFMCKTIIEKSMKGTLTVRNVSGGAEFRIEIQKR